MIPAADCVVFDLDDTVYLERDYVQSGFRAADEWASTELGVTHFGERAWDRFEAGGRGTIFDDVLRDCGVEPSPRIVLALVDVYRRHEPAIELLPDAARIVEALAPLVALAVVTDGPVESQRAKARALGVDQWARTIVFTAELGDIYAKPHPRAFEGVEQVFGVPGARCVYIADNPAKDFAGPRARRWKTVRVRRPMSLHAATPSGPDVDLEVGDFRDLAGLLATLDR
ncbi:MAG: HAD family hydrolase [Acidimicrobiia bacterium]